jgi:hypothetical protein
MTTRHHWDRMAAYRRHGLVHPVSARPATDAAIELLREFRNTPEKPFFLCVGFVEPHRLPYREPNWPGALPGDNSFPGPALKPDSTLGVDIPGCLRDTEGTRRELAGLQGAVTSPQHRRAVELLEGAQSR